MSMGGWLTDTIIQVKTMRQEGHGKIENKKSKPTK